MKFSFFILILFTSLLCINSFAQINWTWASSGGAGVEDYSISTGNGIDFDENDNTYLIGGISSLAQIDTFTLNSYGETDILIAKYDKNGNVIWAKTAGGKYTDVGRSIKYLDGYLYVCGVFSDTVYFDNHVLIGPPPTIFRATFVAKLDTNGNYIWLKQGTNSPFGHSHYPIMSINSDSINNIYYSGFCNKDDQLLDTFSLDNLDYTAFFILQLDTAGNINWVHYVESKPGAWADQHIDMDIDNNNNVVYATSNARRDTSTGTNMDYSNMLIGKLNSFGDVLWEHEIGDTVLFVWYGLPYAMSIDSFGNLYTCGYFINSFYIDTSNHDTGDSFIAKFNGQNGNLIYSKTFENLGFYQCDYDLCGNVIYSGSFSDSIDLGGITLYPYSLSSISNMFIASYDTSGVLNWAVSYGYYGNERIHSSSINKKMHSIAGSFGDSLTLGQHTLIGDNFNTNSRYFFIATQIKPEDTGIISIPNSDLSFKIYPNPTSSNIIIETNGDLSQFTIEIYSFGSKLIRQYDNLTSNIIDVSDLISGTYFVSLRNEKIRVVKRFIKI